MKPHLPLLAAIAAATLATAATAATTTAAATAPATPSPAAANAAPTATARPAHTAATTVRETPAPTAAPHAACAAISAAATHETPAAASPDAEAAPCHIRSIREFGVLPENEPQANARNLQRAIDWASRSGAALYVEPAADGYPVASGIVLRQNVSLIGAHGPVGRGTKHPEKNAPAGSLFVITDAEAPFLTVESSTQVRGIQFWYPEQSFDDPDRITAYPPTIRMSPDRTVQGVTLSCLTFYGEYMAMDFRGRPDNICEQILFEHCYGYPLGGEFIAIDYCYDIPRILHCHVNPANMRLFGRTFSRSIVDSVVARPTFTYTVDHTDNAQMIDLFTFGVHGGIYLGRETYGQLTNFNLDCVTVGIYKDGGGAFNRNWQIAQGSIIANTKGCGTGIHPIIITGEGHTAISNVEAFSGTNPALTADGRSDDFLLVEGDRPLTVSLYGCRMRDYTADAPLTLRNPRARVQAVACVDRDERFYNIIIDPEQSADRTAPKNE